MAAIPEGYVPLGLVGFTDRKEYRNTETYMENDLVHRNNAIWKCKADNTIGILPAENENWEVFINSTTSLEGISAVDTKGIMGTGGEIVASQALIDALATKVMESIPMNKIVNHFMATDPTTVLSGPMGKTLNDRCDQLNSDLSGYGAFISTSTNANLDELKTGIYFYNGYGAFTGEKPFADKFGMIICAKPSSGTRIQTAISEMSELKVRTYTDGVWKSWK